MQLDSWRLVAEDEKLHAATALHFGCQRGSRASGVTKNKGILSSFFWLLGGSRI